MNPTINPFELISPDLVRLALVLGMVLSVFLYERSYLTTGSIVVPGFLGMHFFEPSSILMSVFNAWVCFLLVHKLIPRICFMHNRTKFYALVVVSVLLQLGWNSLASIQTPVATLGQAMAGFGYVIPGLIAHDMARNGALKTSLNTIFVSCLVGGAVLVSLLLAPTLSRATTVPSLSPFHFDLTLVLLLSAVGSVLLKLRTPLRSGGFVTAAYFVTFGAAPLVPLTTLFVAVTTYLLCVNILIPRMIIFGRRKFALMLLVGSVLMWAVLIVLGQLGIEFPLAYHPSYAGIIILLPGLIANDMQRSSVTSVVCGLGLMASWIFVLASLYYEIRNHSRPDRLCLFIGGLISVLLVVQFSQRPSQKMNSLPLPIQHGAAS